MEDFSEIFLNKVLKPQLILPAKQEDQDWENLYDENRRINMFDITVEENGKNLLVFGEGNIEMHNPAKYTGEVFGEEIRLMVENGDTLIMSFPTNIGAWVLKTYKIMGSNETAFSGEPNNIILFTHTLNGAGIMGFSFSLRYQFN